MNVWYGLILRFWPAALGAGLIGLAGVVVVAGCHEREQAPPPARSELLREPTPDPRCQKASKSANDGIAYAAEAQYDRGVEALSQALLSCESPPFQQARRADLARVLQRWSEASQAQGNLDRTLFLQDALLTLEPTSQHQIAYVDALIATRRLALARQTLDELSKTSTKSIGPALEKRSLDLARLDKQHPSPPAEASSSLEVNAQIRQASLELLLGSPVKAASLVQAVTDQSPNPCNLQFLAEALWQSAQQKEARVAWSQALGMLGASFEETGTSLLPFSGGRYAAPELSDDGTLYFTTIRYVAY